MCVHIVQAQTVTLYDNMVTIDDGSVNSNFWTDRAKFLYENPVTIQSRVDFSFPSSILTEVAGNIHNAKLFVQFNNTSAGTWEEVTPSATFSKEYESVLQDGENNIKINYVLTLSSSHQTNDPFLLFFSSDLVIKHNHARHYISPNAIIDVETDNAFSPPSGIYNAATLANTPYFDSYITASKGVGKAYVLYANPEVKKITKPIIFVDGIDFGRKAFLDPAINKTVRYGDTGWDIFIEGLTEGILPPGEQEPYRLYRQSFTDLRSQGFDIIFLDFAEGATFIEKNAQVLRKFLLMLNAGLKTPVNGITNESIVVGCSMGGQIARLCLAEMEQNGDPTCTSTYMSFDSPHLGANIPLSLQSLAWFSANVIKNGSPELWNKLNSPATRQLLVETLGGAMQKGKVTHTVPSWADNPSNITFLDNYDLFHDF